MTAIHPEYAAAFHDAQIQHGIKLAELLLNPSPTAKEEVLISSRVLTRMAKAITPEQMIEMHKRETN